jgi:hypothetical protein
MKSNNNNNNNDDDDDDDNTAMGSVHARGDTFLTFGLKALTETNTSRLATVFWPEQKGTEMFRIYIPVDKIKKLLEVPIVQPVFLFLNCTEIIKPFLFYDNLMNICIFPLTSVIFFTAVMAHHDHVMN